MTNTRRVSDVVHRFPANLFRRPAPQPVLTDGELELCVTYQVHELLLQLPPQSQGRALDHVTRILEENAKQVHEFNEPD